MEYPAVHQSDIRPVHFLQGQVEYLGQQLGIDLRCIVRRPSLYLSDEEKGWTNGVQEHTGYTGRYWLLSSGVKTDYTVKGWGHTNYQQVVDMLSGVVQFVQVGEAHHGHRPLSGTINFIGKTDTRQLIRLAYHADGGLGGVSFLHHVFAALSKPFVTVASGMESRTWEEYPTGRYLSRHGCLPCCRDRACWKSRVVPLGDGDPKDRDSLCVLPVLAGEEHIPKCMQMIRPDEVVRAVMDFYEGGTLG